MNPDQLREVIEEPARKAGLDLEPGLVERLLTDLGDLTGARGSLPLLSHALLKTWEERSGIPPPLPARAGPLGTCRGGGGGRVGSRRRADGRGGRGPGVAATPAQHREDQADQGATTRSN
ncbi:hypothetical protein ALI22I_07150 [Saccharothrix sp. ALI-22-I]|nr:hypothetical protein ALI22I_07150 [Saccharothrix sp. ALI-22-I]